VGTAGLDEKGEKKRRPAGKASKGRLRQPPEERNADQDPLQMTSVGGKRAPTGETSSHESRRKREAADVPNSNPKPKNGRTKQKTLRAATSIGEEPRVWNFTMATGGRSWGGNRSSSACRPGSGGPEPAGAARREEKKGLSDPC